MGTLSWAQAFSRTELGFALFLMIRSALPLFKNRAARRVFSACTAWKVSMSMMASCASSAWYLGSSPLLMMVFLVMWFSRKVFCKIRFPV